MQLPFTAEQFFNVFKNYNISVWPAQVFLNLFAVVAIAFAARPLSALSGMLKPSTITDSALFLDKKDLAAAHDEHQGRLNLTPPFRPII
jgi:hypothetical protein